MIPIKIQCGCGQRYAFDAEPVDGRLTAPVTCPTCGMDGTAPANEIIARSVATPPGMPPPPPGTRMRVTLPATEAPSDPQPPNPQPAGSLAASAAQASRLGLVNREQAEVEARAKVSWGDPPENVLKYLMIQGFQHEEASALLAVLYKERSAEVRARGIKKIVIGCVMIFAAGAGMMYMLAVKFVVARLVGLLIALAAWGLWNVINGAIMVLLPKMQSGDVAES